MDPILIGGIAVVALAVLTGVVAVLLRVVVATNEVHIVQSSKTTVSYGKDLANGNTYYAWPSWIPKIGVLTIRLPVSVFDVPLNEYAAYDKGRVPFKIDIMAFFRIKDSNVAAQRVSNFQELESQLQAILQGAVRTILASSEIEDILEGRSKFGEMFTKEVDHQLEQWGVGSVKMIELMDIRDAEGSQVISNIMAKKKSMIEMQSRVEVAANMKTAKMAEIDAEREVQVRNQEALQQIGQRTAEKDKQVGIANQQSMQAIKEQEKVTTEKQMAVVQVGEVKTAEIQRQVQVVAADQEKQTSIIKAEGIKQTEIVRAEGQKQQTVLVAEGNLEQAKLNAQGIQVEGAAKGEAEKAILMAPVATQITLAKEIGENQGYQQYLVTIEQIRANQVVGVEQAKALTAANIKVIANAGTVPEGVSNVMDLLSSKGGTALGSMVEAFAQTDLGAKLVGKLAASKGNGAAPH